MRVQSRFSNEIAQAGRAPHSPWPVDQLPHEARLRGAAKGRKGRGTNLVESLALAGGTPHRLAAASLSSGGVRACATELDGARRSVAACRSWGARLIIC